MAVKNPSVTHPYYDSYKGRWCVIRDCVAGSSVVKKAGPRYLPMLGGQDLPEYDAYKMRALFMAATQRTLAGYVGMTFRKKPVLAANATATNDFLSRCTVARKGFTQLARQSVREICQMGRMALLMDGPKDSPADSVPWIAVYQAENIINWHYEVDDVTGEQYLESITMMEMYEKPANDDPNKIVMCPRWRVLSVESGTYSVEVYEKEEGTSKQDSYVLVEGPLFPKFAGRTLTEIPIEIIDLTDEDGELTPPLEAITDVNMSHYRTSADLEHGRHFTALPTPWCTGVGTSETKLKIGSQTAWMISAIEAKVGMLEFTGAGLAALEHAMDEKQQMMAVLGARMLETPKNTVEATPTHEIRRSGEQSILADIVLAAQDALNRMLARVTAATPRLGAMSAELNTDFSAISLTAQDITALVGALQAGSISDETFFYNFDQGEMYADGTTFDDEQANRQVAFDKKTQQDMKRLALVPPMNLDQSGGDGSGDSSGA